MAEGAHFTEAATAYWALVEAGGDAAGDRPPSPSDSLLELEYLGALYRRRLRDLRAAALARDIVIGRALLGALGARPD